MRALVRAGLLALIVGACGFGPTPPVVTIARGLHPVLTPAEVERDARDAIASSAMDGRGHVGPLSVVSITAIPGGPWVGPYLAGASWIVEVRGELIEITGFHPETTRRAGGVRVMISDFDGSVISVDFTD
jgi:hypothetical protein